MRLPLRGRYDEFGGRLAHCPVCGCPVRGMPMFRWVFSLRYDRQRRRWHLPHADCIPTQLANEDDRRHGRRWDYDKEKFVELRPGGKDE